MSPENLLVDTVPAETPPNLLNDGLKPVRIGKRIWVYKESERGEQLLEMEEVTGCVVARNPKDICVKNNQPGVSLGINESTEGGLSLTATYCDGGAVISFSAIYHIDQKSGRVVAFERPTRGKTIPLLDIKEGAVVLIPVLRTRKRESGIIITTDKELRNPQNRTRIEGHLRIR